MSERTDASAAFALRLCADLLTALTIKGVFSEDEAKAFVADSLTGALRDFPEHAPQLQHTARTLVAGLEIGMADLRSGLRRD